MNTTTERKQTLTNKIQPLTSKDQVYDKINEIIREWNIVFQKEEDVKKYLLQQNGTEVCKNCGR